MPVCLHQKQKPNKPKNKENPPKTPKKELYGNDNVSFLFANIAIHSLPHTKDAYKIASIYLQDRLLRHLCFDWIMAVCC